MMLWDFDTAEGFRAYRQWQAPLEMFWTFGGTLRPTEAQKAYWVECLRIKSGELPSGRQASWKR